MNNHESKARRVLSLGVAGAIGLVLALGGSARAQGDNKTPSGEVNSENKAKALEYLMTPTVKLLPQAPLPAKNSTAVEEAQMQPYSETLPGSELTFDLVPIKGGTFKMGSPAAEKSRKDDEGPQVDGRHRALLDGQVRGHLGRVRDLAVQARRAAPQGEPRRSHAAGQGGRPDRPAHQSLHRHELRHGQGRHGPPSA